jgi:predicted ATP-grasp superfamily ATP-dependent carboligase
VARADSGPDRVIVLGISTQIGLALIRELRAHGVQVYGVAGSSHALGLFSRDLHHGSVCPRETGARLAHLNELARRHRIPALMAVSEPDLLWLNEHRSSLPDLKLLIPTMEKLSLVLDKDRVYQLAREVGITTPWAVQPGSYEEIESLSGAMEFPVVLKWARQNEIMPLLHRHGLRFDKYRYAYDARELLAALAPFRKVGQYPLIQSYCPGVGLGQMIFMYDRTPRLRFQHLRVHEFPPEGGASSLCESRPVDADAELMDRSVELLRRIDWVGPAMVEYRYDPATKRSVLMEINGRFWGSLPLAHYAGAHFGWYTYSMLGKGVDPRQPDYRAGVRCMHTSPEVKRLARILLNPRSIQDKSLRFGRIAAVLDLIRSLLDPRTKYYIFSWRDPRPAVMDSWFIVMEAVGGAAGAIAGRFRRSPSGHATVPPKK